MSAPHHGNAAGAIRSVQDKDATLKALVYRGPGKKALEDRPKPEIIAA